MYRCCSSVCATAPSGRPLSPARLDPNFLVSSSGRWSQLCLLSQCQVVTVHLRCLALCELYGVCGAGIEVRRLASCSGRKVGYAAACKQ
jgi:hypothetical protein